MDAPPMPAHQVLDEMWDAPMQFGNTKDKTIAHLAAAIDRLTKGEEHHHKPKAQSLGVTLIAGTLINSFSFNVKNKTMSVSFKKTGGATATLNGFAADGVTDATPDLSLTTITAVSNHPEFFTATVDTTNPLIVHLVGVADGVGTVTYTATTLEGVVLPPFVDSVTVADVAPATLATSLGVNYVTF